jgi:hypothetical protein
MKHFEPKNVAILILLGLFAWLAADRAARAVQDGGGGDNDRGLIAVTGSYGSGASALYLIDSRTRHMAVYRLENGRELEFVAARDCSHDFYLETYNDQSEPGMTPSALRQSWREYNARAERASREAQRAASGAPNERNSTGAKPDSTTPPRTPGGAVSPPASGEKGEREQKDD